ncbi:MULTISPECIES: cation:dicarboxylate symporter family transporter [Pseudomonas]|uniref:Proton glutamate symport protein n=1 Tax=Pseudomonas putida TaxID=303 RepID=A0A1B2FB71_PSEPU|nr:MULTISPECIES: cation:dicarboxylase symporter family transporter [Pseudomonas]ANY89386.1 Proton glutamate symport protein [Pseudomonas putida]MCL8307495.1 cation:dicarboxylase symporter family transporter [Pseudomonas putida]
MAKTSLVTKIIVGLVLGILVGALLNIYPDYKVWVSSQVLQPAGDIFIKMMKMIVAPLVFACMVSAVAGNGDSKAIGRVGVKTMFYFFVVTGIAIVCGLIIGNVAQPGTGANLSTLSAAQSLTLPSSSEGGDFGNVMLAIIPDNIVNAMAQGNLLPILFFSIMFGFGVNALDADKKRPLIAVFNAISGAMFKVTHIVMHYSPIGIFGLIGVTVSNFGLSALLPLGKLILVTYAAVLLFGLVVLGGIAKAVGINIFDLIKFIKDELILAFSTATSATVMPQLIEKVEAYGAPRSIATLVIPTGYSFNLDGASLFVGIGTLFIAQLYEIPLSLADQAVLVLIMVLTSKGAAGVPGAMFVILTATLTSAGLPVEGIAFIAGVYRLMDMPITALNVLGNALAPLVIAKWENQFRIAPTEQPGAVTSERPASALASEGGV